MSDWINEQWIFHKKTFIISMLELISPLLSHGLELISPSLLSHGL